MPIWFIRTILHLQIAQKKAENFFQIGKTGDEPEPNLIEFYIKTFHKLNDSSQEILIVIYNYLEGY